MRGRFVTVEGVEGSGKSSNLDFIRSFIEAAGKTVLYTREPGGTPLGEEIRGLLLGHRDDGMAGDTELLLVFAARAEHIHRRIAPALARGDWVLCDRFTDATYAYQGGGRGVPHERVAAIERWVQGDLRPDLTFLLDVPVEVGLERAGRRAALDRIEKEGLAFHERVRAAYLDIARREPQRVRVVDASRGLDRIQQDLAVALEGLLGRAP